MKKIKQWIAVVAVICLLVTCFPVQAFAENDAEGLFNEDGKQLLLSAAQMEMTNAALTNESASQTEEEEPEEEPEDADSEEEDVDTENSEEEDEEPDQEPDDTQDSESEDAEEDSEEDEEEEEDEEDEDEEKETNHRKEYTSNGPGRAVFCDDGTVYNNLPVYFQTDYPDVAYGDGSLATSGCSMASIAMVASYLTGKTITPDDLARRFRNADGSHVQRMEAVAYIYDLENSLTFYWYDVINALKRGKVVIELVGSKSPFTSTQHFVVLTGIRPDGRVLAIDSMEPNYSKEELEEGFETGFSQDILTKGFSGAWIFEPYTPKDYENDNYPTVDMTPEERDLLAKLIWREARGESFEGQQAVAEVVLNRVVSKDFPTDDVWNTIYAQGQFRTAHLLEETVADELQYKIIDNALHGRKVLPRDVYYFSRDPQNGYYWGWIGKHAFCYAEPHDPALSY